MAGAPLVTDIALVLGVATVTGTVARRLEQPPILGYLLAGLIVGPYIPIPLFADVERVHALSELGVVLVMFAVGLEFSLRRAAQVLPLAGLVGAIQIGGMFWAGGIVGQLLGLSTSGQIVLAAALAVSSTMVVTKVFDVHAPPQEVRTVVLGVLVLQDLVAIVLITVVTAVAQGAEADADALAGVIGRLLGMMAAAVFVGLIVVPRLTRRVARLRSPEVDTVFAIGLCFAMAAGMEHLGYSAALGAFVAGMLVADSGLGTRYEHLVAPIRDVFAAVFFVSVGMTVDPRVALDHIGLATLISGAVLVLQGLLVTSAGVLSGLGLRVAGHAGLALGQLGEFAFIIVAIGTAAGIVPPYLYTVIVTVAVLTAFSTSIGLKLAPRLLAGVEHRLPAPMRTRLSVYSAWVDSVRNGHRVTPLGRKLRRHSLVLVLDAAVVTAAIIGGALAVEPVSAWVGAWLGVGEGLATAVVAVATGAVAFAFARGMWRAAGSLGSELAQAAFPGTDGERPDLASTSRTTMTRALRLAALIAAGLLVVALTQPVLPTGLGPLFIGIAVVPGAISLWRSGPPLEAHARSATVALLEVLHRSEREPDVDPHADPQIHALLHGLGDVQPIQLAADAPAVGKTLADLDLRARTGAMVLAIARGESDVSAPTGRETLQAGDVLGLAGPGDAVARARELLQGDEP